MVFIDFENFDIAKLQYYRAKALRETQSAAQEAGKPIPTSAPFNNPKLDFNALPKEIVALLPTPHVYIKTFYLHQNQIHFLCKTPEEQVHITG